VTAIPDWAPADAGPEFATRVVAGDASPVTRPSLPTPRRRTLSLADYVAGVRAGHRTVLARAITLIESNAPAHRAEAQALLAELLPHTGKARRIGITGIPGAGKSTFIEALGTELCERGLNVAVLAIDPSSTVTGGSILGDKVRMERLSRLPNAFIRPSPSGGSLGGVARKTREAMLVCEAAGFDVILVETVGVGQSEVTVRSMVDFFLVLMIAGAGDDVQGIKKGILELADAVVINKADGDNRPRALAAQAEMTRVLHYLQPTTDGWPTPAQLASALTHEGIPEVWAMTERYFAHVQCTGQRDDRRRAQTIAWLHALIDEGLHRRFYARPDIMRRLAALEHAVAAGQKPVVAAAVDLLDGQ
jgi:LAO/AO transport system kinase